MNALSLLTFLVGAGLSFISLGTGIPILLAALGIACLSRYRRRSWFAGSLALIPATIVFVYVLGAVDRDAPVFNTNVSPTVWTIIFVGSVSLVLGLWWAGSSHSIENDGPVKFDSRGSEFFLWVGCAAALVSLINYATGNIPLLSGDIDGTRFSEASGMLNRLWVLVHPITQVNVIIFLLKLQQRQLDPRWVALGSYSILSLILTGGRSLAAIGALAFGILFIELKRPKLQLVFAAALAGALLTGASGLWRALGSANAATSQSYLSRRGLFSWLGSLDLSLQTGPRVLTLAVNNLGGEQLAGRILIGDLPKFGTPYGAIYGLPYGSGYIVTAITGRDSSFTGGGSPPTIFGGLYLDFGWFGVVLGSLLVGFLMVLSRKLMYRKPSLSSYVWFSYFAAYVALSSYSYLSFKPPWIVVLFLCLAGAISWRKPDGRHAGQFAIPQDTR